MKEEEWEKVVEEVIKNLPPLLRKKLKNIEIGIEEKFPSSPLVVGLYQGVPLPRRGLSYTLFLPDRITIFKKNLERSSASEKELKRNLRRVLIHELGHYFGFGEEELRKMEANEE